MMSLIKKTRANRADGRRPFDRQCASLITMRLLSSLHAGSSLKISTGYKLRALLQAVMLTKILSFSITLGK